MNHPSQRLTELARLLNGQSADGEASPPEAAESHLRGSVQLLRIQRLTDLVETRVGEETDDLARRAMRLLLDEYAAAVAHLRDVASEDRQQLDDAATTLKMVRRFLRKQVERQEQRLAATAPSNRQPR